MVLKNEFGQPASRLVRMVIAAITIGVLPMAGRVALAQDTLRQSTGNAETTDPSDRLNTSNSLEQRVDRIETLLKQLIKAQESKSESTQAPGLGPATTVVQPSPKKPVEATFSRVRAVERAETFGLVPATTVRQPVVLDGSADAGLFRPGVLEISDGEGGTTFLDVRGGEGGDYDFERDGEGGRATMRERINNLLRSKQAEIERLSKEVDQLKTALKGY